MTATLTRTVTEGAQRIIDAMDPDSPHEINVIPGVDRKCLAELLHARGYTVGAEVGVESGRYAYELLTRNPGLHLYCVDAWMPYKGYREHVTTGKLTSLFEDAERRLNGLNVTFVKGWSVEMSAKFDDGSLDFVYIDANHDYAHVTEDLEAWVPKVRSGGIVSGHDYCGGKQRSGYVVEVVQAVKDFTAKHGIRPWYVLGTPELVPGSQRERPRDFMWVKE